MAYKVIITGGNGFVGRHLINELNVSWPDAEIISWDLPEVDITNPVTYEDQLAAEEPDWIIHLAALAHVGSSFKNPELVHRVNVEGTVNLLSGVVGMRYKTKVLVVSSADIYGLVGHDPIEELSLTQVKPLNPYAQSKVAMEKVIEEKFNDFCIRVRPFPHIGPGQKSGFVTSDFAAQIADIEAGRQEPVLKVGNLEAKRDFTDVRDVVKAYRLLIEKGRTGEVYNVSSGEAVSIQTILDKLLSLSSVKIKVVTDPDKMRPSDNPVLVGNNNKLKKVTSWQPAISLDQSLEDILNYWRSIT